MFSIHKPEDDNWFSGRTRVVDADRDISLQFKNATGRELGRAFVLNHGVMQIPFHTKERSGLIDEVTGRPYFVTEIVSFGTSFYLRGDRYVPDYVFGSRDRASEWKRVAAEALLIYGLRYDGPKLDPDYTRVLLGGQLLTRRDFHYPW